MSNKASADDYQNGLEPLRHQGLGPDELSRPPSYTPYHGTAPPKSPMRRRFLGSRQSKAPPSRVVLLLRIVCLFLTMALSLSTVGLLTRALSLYHSTKSSRVVMNSGLVRMAWPSAGKVNLLPTYLLLGAGVAVVVAGVIEGVLWCYSRTSQKRSSAPTSRIISGVLQLSLLGLVIAAVAIFKLQDGESSIFGWSCDHKHVELLWDSNEIGLGRVCNAMTAAWAMGIVVTLLQVMMAIIAVKDLLSLRNRPKRTVSFMTGRREYQGLNPVEDHDIVPMINRSKPPKNGNNSLEEEES